MYRSKIIKNINKKPISAMTQKLKNIYIDF